MRKHLMPAISVAALKAARPAGFVGDLMNDAGNADELLAQVSAQLDKLNGEVKTTAESALKEAKQSGEVAAETKATADKLLSEQTTLAKSVDDLKALVEGLDSKSTEMAQAIAERPAGDGGSEVMSLGQAVVAEEEKLDAFRAGGCTGNLLLKVENAVTTAAGSGGGLIYHEEERDPVRLPRRRLLIRALLSQGRTSSDLVTYRRQVLRNDNAAPVAEGAPAPVSEYGWAKATEQVKKISHTTNISEEAMADADQLQTELDTEMRYGLDREEEEQILAGDGVGENLNGLIPNATAFVAQVGLPNATRIDRLRLAMLQIALADYIATGMVLSPVDWAAIELLKVGGADERYVFGNPATGTTPMLWGKDVAESNSMSNNEWLVGDFPMAATYYTRADAEVLISSEHGDNFVEDMLTMKATKRAALTNKRGAAMVTGDFTFA